jgi:hypothetical protein
LQVEKIKFIYLIITLNRLGETEMENDWEEFDDDSEDEGEIEEGY